MIRTRERGRGRYEITLPDVEFSEMLALLQWIAPASTTFGMYVYTVLMLVSLSVQRDIYNVIFFHVSRSTRYMVFDNKNTHKVSYFWQYGIKAGCSFVKWYWFMYTVRDKWKNISRDEVEWDIFSFVTNCIQKSLSFDKTTSCFYTILSIITQFLC